MLKEIVLWARDSPSNFDLSINVQEQPKRLHNQAPTDGKRLKAAYGVSV